MCDDGGRHMGYVNLCLLQIEKKYAEIKEKNR
jgi:hypothetical protein